MTTSSLRLLAPVSGQVLPLTTVPDPVFAQKMVGDGIAIDPTSEVLLAPCDGEITLLHPAHHAVTLKTDSGAEIILHIGIDTVQLKGKGFTPKVKLGDRVSAGQELIAFDADFIAQNAKSLITLMVIAGDAQLTLQAVTLAKAGTDVLIELVDEAATAAGAKDAPVNSTSAVSQKVRVQLTTGFHARPAARLVNQAKSYSSQIDICKDSQGAVRSSNIKSVVGILGLEIAFGDEVYLRAQGGDAERAVTELATFLSGLTESSAEAGHAADSKKLVMPASKPLDIRSGVFSGLAISPGYLIGHIQQFRTQEIQVSEQAENTPAEEQRLLDSALAQSRLELESLAEKMNAKMDASDAAIFSMHRDLLDDPELALASAADIARGKSAAFSWHRAYQAQAETLANLQSEVLSGRAIDVRDVGRRVLKALLHGSQVSTKSTGSTKKNVILIADTLTPSDLAQLDLQSVVAICTTSGGATSHVAIMARSMGLAAIAGLNGQILELPDDTEVLVDANRGEFRLSPTSLEKAEVARLQLETNKKRSVALSHAQAQAVTRDGKRIDVAANIGSVSDAIKAVELGADGVGLLRSEFLFLERDTAPSEDEQLEIYQAIATALGGRHLVIRTLDVGGDKPLKYLPIDPEENPFLGIRGIRIGLLYQEILRSQLRAILRVRSEGRLHVMFPMIATVEEFRQAKAILEEERLKLGVAQISVGVMIEVPSAALIADVLAKEADFFSIGTNDLTQYTLAMDRGHKDLAQHADALHPSVLKLIGMTCRAAKAHGKWVGVCGGLAGELEAVGVLIGLGVDELSVSVPSIPLVKERVREMDLVSSHLLAQLVLEAQGSEEVREHLARGSGMRPEPPTDPTSTSTSEMNHAYKLQIRREAQDVHIQ